MFAFIFPAFILSAIESNSENFSPIIYNKRDLNAKNNSRPVTLKLQLFRLALRVTDLLFKIFDKKKPVNKLIANNNNNNSKRNEQIAN
jgi:hypothetical protein